MGITYTHRAAVGAQWLTLLAGCLIASSALASNDQAALANEADGRNWAAGGRTFSEQRFSPLDAINPETVDRLGLAWSLDFPDVWNVSTIPLAVDGVIYVAAGFTVLHAVDARSGKLLWKYDPKVDPKNDRPRWHPSQCLPTTR